MNIANKCKYSQCLRIFHQRSRQLFSNFIAYILLQKIRLIIPRILNLSGELLCEVQASMQYALECTTSRNAISRHAYNI